MKNKASNKVLNIENGEILSLGIKEILTYLVDLNMGILEIFDRHQMYRKCIDDYWGWRNLDHKKFSQKIYRLKQQKLIRIYKEGKKKYIKLTPKGIDKLKGLVIDDIEIQSPKKWDKKWRIVIFDIPNDKKVKRNIFRERLERLGFISIQESVFVHPFECKKEIDFITTNYYIKSYVKYIIADMFEGDEDLIPEFLERNILNKKIID